MKFVLILFLVGFESSGKTMVEFSHKFSTKQECIDVGNRFKENNHLGRGNWKEFECLLIGDN